MSVGEAIKFIREGKHKSARSLSLECGMSEAYVGKVESGEIEPSLKAFAKIATALEMSTQEIVYLIIQESTR